MPARLACCGARLPSGVPHGRGDEPAVMHYGASQSSALPSGRARIETVLDRSHHGLAHRRAGPFHEEVGYWLWDPKEKQVLRCFIVPRGVSGIAGGTAEPTAKSFTLSAEAGSETYGICSNRFLDRAFKTVRYELTVTVHNTQTFSYEEDTQLRIKGQGQPFHHRDKNRLKRMQSV
ncbi:MAG: DUF1794 domain-containing protein [Nitrospirae bacterium]|nr:MAG: DUF1794 domain-containing protein [Nitrospirota bacterium]